MAKFTDTNFLELFFETGHVDHRIFNKKRSDTHFKFSVCRHGDSIATHRKYILSYFESIKAAALPWSSSIADYLLRMMWIRQVKLEMDPPTKDEVFTLVRRAFAHNGNGIITAEQFEEGFDSLLQKKCLYGKEVPSQTPGITFERDWIEVYRLTPKGKRYAKRMVETKKEILARIKSSPIAHGIGHTACSESTLQPVRKTKERKLGTEKDKQDREELHGRKMAAVQFAISHPNINIFIIEQQYILKKKALSRKPYGKMIRDGRKLTRSQSARKIASKEEKDDFYNYKKLGDDKSRNKKR